jgi:predicted amidophosphoribosyltransferase
VLLVARCPVCRCVEVGVCAACAGQLRAAADPLPIPPGLDSLTAVIAYEGAGRQLIAGLKYRNARGGIDALAAAMAARIEAAHVEAAHVEAVRVETAPLQVVTWLPTTSRRAGHRGYDQAELLARQVAARLRLRCRRLLVRHAGPAQTGRGLGDRLVGPDLTGVSAAAGLVVALVDDVVTSGASMTAGAMALRRAGAREIHGVAAAHTPRTLGPPGTARSGPWTSP